MSNQENLRQPNPDELKKAPSASQESINKPKGPTVPAEKTKERTKTADDASRTAKLQSLKTRTNSLHGLRDKDSLARKEFSAAAEEELASLDPNSARHKEVTAMLNRFKTEKNPEETRSKEAANMRERGSNSKREYTSFLLGHFEQSMRDRSGSVGDSYKTFLTAALAQMEESDKSGAKMMQSKNDRLTSDLGFNTVYFNDLKNERNFLTARINLWGDKPEARLFEDRIEDIDRQLNDGGSVYWDGGKTREQYFADLRSKNPPGETMSPAAIAKLKNTPLPAPKNQAEYQLQKLHDASHSAAMKDLPTLSPNPRGKNIRDRINNAVADSKNVLTGIDEKRMGEIAAMQKELSGVMAYKQAIAELQKEGKKPDVSPWMLSRYDTIRSGLVILAKEYPSALDDVKPDQTLIESMKELAMKNVAPETVIAKNDTRNEIVARRPVVAPRMNVFGQNRETSPQTRVEMQRMTGFNRGGGFAAFIEALGRFLASFSRKNKTTDIAKNK